MKDIKVFLKYPWIVPDSTFYKNLLKHPPKKVVYINAKNDNFKGVSSTSYFHYLKYFKRYLKYVINIFKIPNLVKVKPGDFDLIHCAHCLNRSNLPWIVDFEAFWSFSVSSNISNSYFGRTLIKKYLARDECKKILAWDETAKKEFEAAIKDKKILNKLEILSPGFPMPKYKREKKNNITLLFIARYFYQKGGQVAVKVFDELTKKYDNVNAIIVSDTPKEFIKKYASDKIRFHYLMPQEKLYKEIYPKSDIFVYPGFSDSFGFSMVEAMSFGLPVVTVDGYARKDVVTDGKTGFVVDRTTGIDYVRLERDPDYYVPEVDLLVNELVKKTSLLIENKTLLTEFRRNAIKEVDGGRFSLEVRNKKLRKIYLEAL